MTVAIDVINRDVLNLLADLERMRLIRVLPPGEDAAAALTPEDWAGDEPENGLAATIAACQEARDIMSGKTRTKTWDSVDDWFDDLQAEIAAERVRR